VEARHQAWFRTTANVNRITANINCITGAQEMRSRSFQICWIHMVGLYNGPYKNIGEIH